jgi:hypothetical protein
VIGSELRQKLVVGDPGGRREACFLTLTTRAEIDLWMTAPAEEGLKLQRPLADGAIRIVARGGKEDEGGLTV